MKLHLGKITNKELADWFGVAYSTFNNTKKNKLKELEAFADYHLENKKVVIDNIYVDEYNKDIKNARKIVEENFNKEWSENGLDTCKRVGLALKERFGDKLDIAESTTKRYTLETRKKYYGTPCLSPGLLGRCSYVWCKKIGDGADAAYDFLNEEEEKKKQELLKQFFGDATEKQVIVQAMIERGEIRKEDAWDVLDDLTNINKNFFAFLNALSLEIGATVVRGTLVDKQLEVSDDKFDWE